MKKLLILLSLVSVFCINNDLYSVDTKKATFYSNLDKAAEIKIIDAKGNTHQIGKSLTLEKVPAKKGLFGKETPEMYIKDVVVSKASEFKGTKKASDVKGLLEYINGYINAQNNVVFNIKYQPGSTGLSISAS
jgi:hypothetical protein